MHRTVQWYVFISLFSSDAGHIFMFEKVHLLIYLCDSSTMQTKVGNTWTFHQGIVPDAIAWGIYSDETNSVGSFGSLSINTNSSFGDDEQMYAAGYLEGYLTQSRIYQQYSNVNAWIVSNFVDQKIPANIQTFFATQDKWNRANVISNSSEYWATIGFINNQFDGLRAGYDAAAPANQAIDEFGLQTLNAVGDFLDLIPALGLYNISTQKPYDEMSREELIQAVRKNNHCSALIKTTGNYSDIWFGHSAWFIYQSTIRILKHYKFNLNSNFIAGTEMSFSSYPGYLSSLDDYYSVWSSQLNILETTNNVFNKTLYTLVVPQSLFAWQRVRAANLLSRTGPAWSEYLGYYNSGTYNNAYMITDLKLFTPGSQLKPYTLVEVEQIPGLVVWSDVTQLLAMGYFPSFNVPFQPEIYEKSGYPEMIRKHVGKYPATAEELGDLAGLDWQLAPRMTIFRRDQAKVMADADFLSILRYNDYKNDPYAGGDPWNAICSRGDLASSGSPDGCLDTKAGSYARFAAKQTYVINGPTTGSIPGKGTLPPFAWTQFPNTPHAGLPPVYNFEFELQEPNW
jgi:Phospholipase B